MNRNYQHRFDWEQAKARYANGDTIGQIAKDAGVTWTAVQRVVKPAIKQRMGDYSKNLKGKGRCDRCGGPMNQQSRYRGSTNCKACAIILRATSVRETTLQCITCREWKPDTSFPTDKRRISRRGRHRQCTPCNTIARREYRHRNIDKQRAYDRAYKAKQRTANTTDTS